MKKLTELKIYNLIKRKKKSEEFIFKEGDSISNIVLATKFMKSFTLIEEVLKICGKNVLISQLYLSVIYVCGKCKS